MLAIDGNQEALRILERILQAFRKRTRLAIEYTIDPVIIENEKDLDSISKIISDKYDFILSCKTICEMASNKRLGSAPYKNTVQMLSKKLSSNGIILIEDVTIKNNGEYIPVTLNTELNEFIRENCIFSTLSPLSCRLKGYDCKKGCFFKKEIKLSHSRKRDDVSKIVYRFISHKEFADKFSIPEKADRINCIIS